MLAVHNPAMGSAKPSYIEMPFGYSFDTSSNFPFPSPTAPAPGPSLLDDSEAKYLENFFDGVSNEPFNYNDMFTNAPDGSELGMGWNELPPTFMGTTSSFGQQPVIGNHGLEANLLQRQSFGSMNNHINTAPMIPASTAADVLEAATLLQNGSAGRSNSMAEGALFGAHDMSLQSTNGPTRSQSISQYPPSRPSHGLPQRAAGEEFFHHSYYRDMVLGPDPEETMRRRLALQRNVEMQWGSDTRFASPQGYASADHQEKIAAAERSHLQVVDSAFRLDVSNLNSSAENTQPSSPVHSRTKSNPQNGEEHESKRRKRRKSKVQEDEDDEDDFNPPQSASKSNGKKRKPTKKSTDDSPTPETGESGHKRRKSTAANAGAMKVVRENLTEDQKRENHIKSEQKRRSLIKEGFDDLNDLVPGLKGGGFSKSAVLIMAADWLEGLLKGNAELKRRIEEMEDR